MGQDESPASSTATLFDDFESLSQDAPSSPNVRTCQPITAFEVAEFILSLGTVGELIRFATGVR